MQVQVLSPVPFLKCSKCKIDKPKDEFAINRTTKTGRQRHCKVCTRSNSKAHYIENRRQYYDRNARERTALLALVREKKKVPCADCRKTYPYYVMDFDHRPGELKIAGVCHIHRKGKTKTLAEMKKCDVVCANCHRERTHRRRIAKI